MSKLSKKEKQAIKEAKRKFLECLSDCGITSQACMMSGVPESMVKRWLMSEKFQRRFNKAMDIFVDSIEAEAIRRARQKSDTLLINILRAKRPEVYGPRVDLRHSGNIDEPVRIIFSPDEVGEADVPHKPDPS